ncbi:MAG: Zn-dependent alcohol dehydrogenase [Dehalococcoidia bacterium]|nr:Zn-dependent alcohol dehydrogenase [Dehalococcoidia bacterium]
MKAAVLYEPKTRMPIVELKQQAPRSGEVLVRIGAAGVCASDHHVIIGTAKFPLPIVLGHEGAGMIEAVGENVTSVKPGQRVVLSFVPSCGFCRSCRSGMGQLCDTHRATGPRQFDGTTRLMDPQGKEVFQYTKMGVFGEAIVTAQQACYPLPDDVPMDVAALIGCSVTTGVGAVINQPNIRAGMTVAVFGCGGVGLNALQGAKLVNASRIIAVDVHDHKLEFAYKFGATDVVNAKSQDAAKVIRDLTGGGVDFAFDTFGSARTSVAAYDSTRKTGTTVVVGLAPDGEKAPFDLVDMVRNQKSVVGSYYSSISPHESFRTVLDFYRKGRLDVGSMIVRRYSLDQINEGFDDLARGEDGRGVVVFRGVS